MRGQVAGVERGCLGEVEMGGEPECQLWSAFPLPEREGGSGGICDVFNVATRILPSLKPARSR